LYDPVAGSWSDLSDAGWITGARISSLTRQTLHRTHGTWAFSAAGAARQTDWAVCTKPRTGVPPDELTGSLFDRVTSITFNPQNSAEAFLTTETQGLWMSNAMNFVTPLWTPVTSYPFRQPERVFFNPYNPNEMWVTSFGNGMRVGMNYPAGINNLAGENNDIEVYPNPCNEQLCFTLMTNHSPVEKVNVYDVSGQLLITEKTWKECYKYDVTEVGIYVIEFIFNDHSRVYKKDR